MTSFFLPDDVAQCIPLGEGFLRSENMARWTDAGVLLAVSGGADSTALLRCFTASIAQYHAHTAVVHVAHVNHGLRGCESDNDAMFVRQLAGQFGLPYHETRLTPEMLSEADFGSMEAVARKLRYNFLQHTAEQNALRYVAVAHNADDQAETILHRILRGTGIAGLAGIPPVRPLGDAVTLIRPMLVFSRWQILACLDAIKQPFCIDSTNAESHYTRNKIRNDLLPQLASVYNHAVVDAIIRLGTQAAEWSEYVKSQTDALYDRAVSRHADHVAVRLETLSDVPLLLVRELFVMIWSRQHWHLRDMTFTHWQQLAEMTLGYKSTPRKQTFPGAITVEKTTVQLILQPNHV